MTRDLRVSHTPHYTTHSQEGEYDRKDPVIRTNHEAIVSAIQQLHEHDPSSHYQKLLDEMDPENPAEFVDLAAAVMTSEPEMQQVYLFLI